MVTIRYVNKNDIEYIKHILTIHDVFFKDYISIILDKLILNKNIVSCLIAESNGKQIGFDINVLDMYNFWNTIYKNLNFIGKYKYIRDNKKDNNYNFNKPTSICNNVINNLYTPQNNIAYTLFYYNSQTNKNIKGFMLGIIQMIILKNFREGDFLYQSAEIKQDNILSIESYKKRGFNTTSFSYLPNGNIFAVINIKNIEKKLKTFKINANILY